MHSTPNDEVLRNAKRLLADAELLFNNQRYGSATSLAILCLEEAGKACLIRWKREGLISRDIKEDIRRYHFHKQRVLSCFIAAQELLLALADYYEAPDTIPKLDKSMEDFANPSDYMQYMWKDIMTHAANDETTLAYVAERSFNRSVAYAYLAETKTMDRLKQTGFYVDVDVDMTVRAPLIDITHELAEEMISLARTAVSVPSRNKTLQLAIAAIYEKGPRFKA